MVQTKGVGVGLDQYRIDVLGKDTDGPQLRLRDAAGKVLYVRPLTAQELSGFVAEIEAAYQAGTADPVRLGRRLHDWRDGERTISCIQDYRRLCIRWEKSRCLFSGLLHMTCMPLLLSEVVR